MRLSRDGEFAFGAGVLTLASVLLFLAAGRLSTPVVRPDLVAPAIAVAQVAQVAPAAAAAGRIANVSQHGHTGLMNSKAVRPARIAARRPSAKRAAKRALKPYTVALAARPKASPPKAQPSRADITKALPAKNLRIVSAARPAPRPLVRTAARLTSPALVALAPKPPARHAMPKHAKHALRSGHVPIVDLTVKQPGANAPANEATPEPPIGYEAQAPLLRANAPNLAPTSAP